MRNKPINFGNGVVWYPDKHINQEHNDTQVFSSQCSLCVDSLMEEIAENPEQFPEEVAYLV